MLSQDSMMTYQKIDHPNTHTALVVRTSKQLSFMYAQISQLVPSHIYHIMTSEWLPWEDLPCHPNHEQIQNLTCDSNLIDVQTEVDCTTSNSRKTVGQLPPGLTIKHLLESFDQPSRSDILSLTPWPICFPLSSPVKPGNETVCEVLIVSKNNFFGDMDVNTKSGCHRQDSPSDCHALQKE